MSTPLGDISTGIKALITAVVAEGTTVDDYSGDESGFPEVDGIFLQLESGITGEKEELGGGVLSAQKTDAIVHFRAPSASSFHTLFDQVTTALNDKTITVTGSDSPAAIKPNPLFPDGRTWVTAGVRGGVHWVQQAWSVEAIVQD